MYMYIYIFVIRMCWYYINTLYVFVWRCDERILPHCLVVYGLLPKNKQGLFGNQRWMHYFLENRNLTFGQISKPVGCCCNWSWSCLTSKLPRVTAVCFSGICLASKLPRVLLGFTVVQGRSGLYFVVWQHVANFVFTNLFKTCAAVKPLIFYSLEFFTSRAGGWEFTLI